MINQETCNACNHHEAEIKQKVLDLFTKEELTLVSVVLLQWVRKMELAKTNKNVTAIHSQMIAKNLFTAQQFMGTIVNGFDDLYLKKMQRDLLKIGINFIVEKEVCVHKPQDHKHV